MTKSKIKEKLNIVFEDNHILVVVKPHNLPVCEDGTGDIDLLRILKQYLIEENNKIGDAYLGLVHRLDRPTGGVMVFAKTSKAASRLSAAIREGEMEKKYLAVLDGIPNKKQDELVHYLFKKDSTNEVYSVPMTTLGAKKAVLNYKVLETKDKYSLVDVRLVTGRSHQIRVQMATQGTPILFDRKYGREKDINSKLPLALWAAEIKFKHPVTKELMAFRVFPPGDKSPWKIFNIDLHLNISIKY